MRVGELKSAKMMFFFCLLLFVALVMFQQNTAPPVLLKGVVKAVQEQDGVARAFSVEVEGERYVVNFSSQYLRENTPPTLARNQEVELTATRFKAVKQGVICEFVALVKAGPVREDLAPEGNEALPVDDLKSTLGYKGM